MSRLSVAQGDITCLSVDVIVNAVNDPLLGGAAARIAAVECGRFLERDVTLSSLVLIAFESATAAVLEGAVARQLDGRGGDRGRI